MIQRLFLVGSLFVSLLSSLYAQQLLEPSNMFSHKKIAEFRLVDGTVLKARLREMTYKKGLISSMELKDTLGNMRKLWAREVQSMYLPPSGMDKFSRSMDRTFDAQKWEQEEIKDTLLREGYVFFEQVKVEINDKPSFVLVQLLNPHFSKNIRIYHDPYSNETMRFGVAGITVAGGEDTSYYVLKPGGEPMAERIQRRNYRKKYETLWQDCPSLMKRKDGTIYWSDFIPDAFQYHKCK
jgi:hypothetical protein